MLERVTYGVRDVLIDAQAQARALGHPYIGTEHMLLGLVSLQRHPARLILESMRIDPGRLRELVLSLLNPAPRSEAAYLPFTPAAEKALTLALAASLELGATQMGTEHLLLGVVREGGSAIGRVVAELDVDPDALVREVAALNA